MKLNLIEPQGVCVDRPQMFACRLSFRDIFLCHMNCVDLTERSYKLQDSKRTLAVSNRETC